MRRFGRKCSRREIESCQREVAERPLLDVTIRSLGFQKFNLRELLLLIKTSYEILCKTLMQREERGYLTQFIFVRFLFLFNLLKLFDLFKILDFFNMSNLLQE